MAEIEKWVITYIAFYLIFVTLIIFFVANSNYSMYDLTSEQKTVLDNPSTDGFTLLNKLLTVSSLNTSYATLATITGILTVIFIIAVAVAIAEFIPFL